MQRDEEFTPVESEVSIHARKMGCVRPPPLSGLCVSCPFRATCTVQRIPIVLWTARIAMESGRAEPVFYFNDLSTSPLAKEPKTLPLTGKSTFRKTAVEMRCGDLCKGTMTENELILTDVINLWEFCAEKEGQPKTGCQGHIIMDSRQVRYHHFSNFGRKATIAIQACSKECATELSAHLNKNWHEVAKLVRALRPLRKME